MIRPVRRCVLASPVGERWGSMAGEKKEALEAMVGLESGVQPTIATCNLSSSTYESHYTIRGEAAQSHICHPNPESRESMFIVIARRMEPNPFALSLSKGCSWFDELTTNGSITGNRHPRGWKSGAAGFSPHSISPHGERGIPRSEHSNGVPRDQSDNECERLEDLARPRELIGAARRLN